MVWITASMPQSRQRQEVLRARPEVSRGQLARVLLHSALLLVLSCGHWTQRAQWTKGRNEGAHSRKRAARVDCVNLRSSLKRRLRAPRPSRIVSAMACMRASHLRALSTFGDSAIRRLCRAAKDEAHTFIWDRFAINCVRQILALCSDVGEDAFTMYEVARWDLG